MKTCLLNKLKYKEGSTLVLMILIIAAVIMLGTTLLSVTMSQFLIRKSNSDIKRAFYLSENGINEAYLNAFNLINEASDNSLINAEEYLFLNPEDIAEAMTVYKNSYKQYTIRNAKSYINNGGNPTIKIVNENNLYFVSENLNIKVSSKYISSTGIEKTIDVEINVSIPDFIKARAGDIEFFKLLDMSNFEL